MPKEQEIFIGEEKATEGEVCADSETSSACGDSKRCTAGTGSKASGSWSRNFDKHTFTDTKKRQAEVVAISPLRQSPEREARLAFAADTSSMHRSLDNLNSGTRPSQTEALRKSIDDPLAHSEQPKHLDAAPSKKSESGAKTEETETSAFDLRNLDAELRARLSTSAQSDSEAQARVNDAFNELFGALRGNVLGEFERLRVRHTNETTSLLRRERDARERETSSLLSENERLRDQLEALERGTLHKETLIETLQKDVAERDSRVVRERHLSEWRTVFLERRCEQRLLAMAEIFHKMKLQRRVFHAWFGETAASNWKVRVERACVARAKQVCLETASNYEARIRDLLQQLEEAHRETATVRDERDKFESALKQTFIRGIRSLNLDAIIGAASQNGKEVERETTGRRLMLGSNLPDLAFQSVPTTRLEKENLELLENAPKASASRAEYEPRAVPAPAPAPAPARYAASTVARPRTASARPRSVERRLTQAQRNAALVERHDRVHADNLACSSTQVNVGVGALRRSVPFKANQSAM